MKKTALSAPTRLHTKATGTVDILRPRNAAMSILPTSPDRIKDFFYPSY